MKPQVPRDLLVPIVTSLVIVSLLLYLLFTTVQQGERLDEARADRAALAEQLEAQQKTSEALAQQVQNLGGEPVVDPEDAEEPIDPVDPDDDTSDLSQGDIALAISAYCADTEQCIGEDGKRGAPGKDAKVTPAQVAAAVARYCDEEGCTGPRGRRGPPGPPPSEAAILAAVEDYCAGGQCVGPAGEDGSDGEDGEDSDVPGPQGEPGRPPTPEEIRAAVEAYCSAHNNCQGPQGPIGPQGPPGDDSHVPGPRGPQGPPGEDGEDGASIVETTCRAEGTWLFRYSDGTTSTSPGPCRVTETTPTEPPEQQ